MFASLGHAQYWLPFEKWNAVTAPPRSDAQAYYTWSTKIQQHIEWRVSRAGAEVRVDQVNQGHAPPLEGPRPPFVPKAGKFSGGHRFAAVEDGWLVGFNRGEFGAALYWFSKAGERSYKVSDHQLGHFLASAGAIRALEGLAHGDLSRGSLIGIARDGATGRWRADTIAQLPSAPCAFSVLRDGTHIVVLTDDLVAIDARDRVRMLVSPADWKYFYPNSSALSADERTLYVGMRWYVAEVDLAASRVRFRVPTRAP